MVLDPTQLSTLLAYAIEVKWSDPTIELTALAQRLAEKTAGSDETLAADVSHFTTTFLSSPAGKLYKKLIRFDPSAALAKQVARLRSTAPAQAIATKQNPYSPIQLRETDYINLGLKTPNGEWDLEKVFATFKEAPAKVLKMLIDRITRPKRSAAKVKELREPLSALLEWALKEAKGNRERAAELLQGISGLVREFDDLANSQIKGVRNWEGSFYYELMMLRDAHFVSSHWHGLLSYNRVYPETTVALMRIAQMIVALEHFYQTLPDEKVFQYWKKAIRKVLDHPELKPFRERQKFLKAAVAYDNPYVFVDEAGWNSEAARHIYFSEEYSRAKESDPNKGKQIQARLRTSGELDDILREFKELADPASGLFAELWKTNVPSEEQVAGRKRQPQSQGIGAKHPFVRQFPDGVMTNILAEMDFYCRAAVTALEANHAFATMVDDPGTIKLESFVNPLLTARRNIVPITINLGKGKNALLLSGPNMGGKTASARSILLAVLLNQASLPIPASSSELSLFRNIYSVFPRNEQLQEGQGYFGDILKEFVELTAHAREGDLVIIDEVPTGTDYYELVAVTVVLIEDLIKHGATVIVTGHLKKAFELIAKRTGQTPYMQTADDSGQPNFGIKEGIAKRSFGIELTRKAGFPYQVTELALAYYHSIMEGTPPDSLPALEVPEDMVDSSDSPASFEAADSLLRNLYSKDLFAFEQTQDRVVSSLFNSVQGMREHAETMDEIQTALGVRGATDPLFLQVPTPRIGEPEQRLRLTALFVAQPGNYLKELTRLLGAINKINEERSFHFEEPLYDHKKLMGKFEKLKKTLLTIIEHLQTLGENPFLAETIQALNRTIEWTEQVKKLFADEDGNGLDKEKSAERLFARLQPLKSNLRFNRFITDVEKRREELEKTSQVRKGRILDDKALKELHQVWQGHWENSLNVARSVLGPVDEITGSARGALKHGLKPPVMVDEAHILEIRDSKPYRTAHADDFEPSPFIKNGVPQTLAMNPEKPVLVLTGPNSSGKTALMLTAYMEAIAATHGFYTSGNVRLSHFDNVFAFFGGDNVTWRGESYFLDILNKYAEMLKQVTPNSLVILDELHGTDNFELAAIQLAVLHYLRQRNVTVLYNTHIRDGLKLAADRIGLDLRQTDVSFDPQTFKIKPRFTISPDPELKSHSYGLAIAKQWLTANQHQRALSLHRELTIEEAGPDPTAGSSGSSAPGNRSPFHHKPVLTPSLFGHPPFRANIPSRPNLFFFRGLS